MSVTVHLLHAELFPQHFFFKYSSRFSTSVTQHRGYPPARFRGWGLLCMGHLLLLYIRKPICPVFSAINWTYRGCVATVEWTGGSICMDIYLTLATVVVCAVAYSYFTNFIYICDIICILVYEEV
jgi:hypothetical protein